MAPSQILSLGFACVHINVEIAYVIPTSKFSIMYIYKDIITIEAGKRSGKPCIRGMRITVEDILRYLASDMSFGEILEDFPELTKQDLLVALEFAAMRMQRTMIAA